jgi:plasmid stabilization system protein ParE
MAFVHTRPQAEADLEEIWWYIAQDNPGRRRRAS